MMNYCQAPESGQYLYRCGWEGDTSPIGKCHFSVSCPFYHSQCTHSAEGYCLSGRAQNNADQAAQERRYLDEKAQRRRRSARSDR